MLCLNRSISTKAQIHHTQYFKEELQQTPPSYQRVSSTGLISLLPIYADVLVSRSPVTMSDINLTHFYFRATRFVTRWPTGGDTCPSCTPDLQSIFRFVHATSSTYGGGKRGADTIKEISVDVGYLPHSLVTHCFIDARAHEHIVYLCTWPQRYIEHPAKPSSRIESVIIKKIYVFPPPPRVRP